MPAWVAFGALTLALLAVLLFLSVLSAGAVEPTSPPERSTTLERSQQGSHTATRRSTGATSNRDRRLPRFEPPGAFQREAGLNGPRDDGDGPPSMSTGALLANVALTQGLFGVALLAGAFYFAIPLSSLGIGQPPVTPELALLGLGGGLLLWLGNEAAAAVADAAGAGFDESVRSLLTPDSAGGWVLLLVVILPIIAFVEELLFRGAAIGAMAVGFDLPTPLLVVVSSLAFGGAHGAQGRIGAAIATVLGLVLGVAFVLTGSLFVVVLAHYLVNALEFVVHEGMDVDRPVANA